MFGSRPARSVNAPDFDIPNGFSIENPKPILKEKEKRANHKGARGSGEDE